MASARPAGGLRQPSGSAWQRTAWAAAVALTLVLLLPVAALPARGFLASFEYPLTLRNPNPGIDDRFGWSVAGSGNMVLVGAPFADIGRANNSGAAYLFDASTGSLLQTFRDPTRSADANFGWSVAFVGNQALIGAPGASLRNASNVGASYLFDSTRGTLLQSLSSPSPRAGARFGHAVAAIGQRVLIGAPYDSGTTEEAGAAFLFDPNTGIAVPTFLPRPPSAKDNFGWSVTGVGGVAAVGAPHASVANVVGAGVVHLFDPTSGVSKGFLPNPSPALLSQFGWSVAGVGNRIVVGINAVSAGSDLASQNAPEIAYLLSPNPLESVGRSFTNPAPAPRDQFGYSAAGVGNNVLVGAPSDNTGGSAAGAAYLFDGDTGSLLHTFVKPGANNNDQFGWSVAGVGNDVAIGAPGDDTFSPNGGATYLFPAITVLATGSDARTVTIYATQTATNTVSATATFTETRLVPTPVVPAETTYALIGVPVFFGLWAVYRSRNKGHARKKRRAAEPRGDD